MKNIDIITIENCLVCEIVEKTITEICKNKEINIIKVVCNRSQAKEIYRTVMFPTVVLLNDETEVARIFGSMPIDFYKTVIDKFEML